MSETLSVTADRLPNHQINLSWNATSGSRNNAAGLQGYNLCRNEGFLKQVARSPNRRGHSERSPLGAHGSSFRNRTRGELASIDAIASQTGHGLVVLTVRLSRCESYFDSKTPREKFPKALVHNLRLIVIGSYAGFRKYEVLEF
jgi:hypothetical protein